MTNEELACRKADELAVKHEREFVVVKDDSYPYSKFYPYHVVGAKGDALQTFFIGSEVVYSTADI